MPEEAERPPSEQRLRSSFAVSAGKTRTNTVFSRLNGVFILVSSAGISGMGWLVLSLLAENLRKNPDFRADVGSGPLFLIDHRAWWPLLAMPVILAGAVLATAPHRLSRARQWLTMTIAYAWLVPMFAMVVWAFVMFLSPLYQYKPL